MKTAEKAKKRSRQDASAGEYIAPEIKEFKIMTVNILCSSDQNTTHGGYTDGEEEGY